jgi:hypothetical protein
MMMTMQVQWPWVNVSVCMFWQYFMLILEESVTAAAYQLLSKLPPIAVTALLHRGTVLVQAVPLAELLLCWLLLSCAAADCDARGTTAMLTQALSLLMASE